MSEEARGTRHYWFVVGYILGSVIGFLAGCDAKIHYKEREQWTAPKSN